MNSSKILANRLREVILNGTWIAFTNFKDQLEKIDWESAEVKIGSLNSIAMLAQHIHYYIHGILNVFINGKLEIRDKYSFDFPPIRSQAEWESFQERFWKDTEELAKHIEQLTDEQLEKPFVDEKYGYYYRNMDGIIEHCYYHLGQVVLIHKVIKEKQ